MQHCGTQEIKTERLLLRRFRASDAHKMYQNWASDPEVVKYLTWDVHQNEAETLNLLKSWIKSYDNPDQASYNWAIELSDPLSPNQDAPTLIGNISVVGHSDRHFSMELGYCMGKAWWNKGYMTEALGAVIRYLFEKTDVNRISIRCDQNNVGSERVMQKNGLFYEGFQRQVLWTSRGFHNCRCYAITRDQWV